MFNLTLYLAYCLSRQHDEAIRQIETALVDLHPVFSEAHLVLGQTYIRNGRYEEAIASHKKAPGLGPAPETDAFIERSFRLSGATDETRRIFEESLRQQPVQPYLLAAIYQDWERSI